MSMAIEQLNEALRLKPSLVQAHSNLAVAYYQKRDYEAARREVRLARDAGVEVNPEFVEGAEGEVRDLRLKI